MTMERAWSSEKSVFSKIPARELLAGASSVGKARIECRVPIVARQSGDDFWQASLELPSEILSLSKSDQYRLLTAVEESVAELQRLHADPESEAVATPECRLRLACGIWLNTGFSGEIQCTVNFEWPEVWIDFPNATRANVLDGIDRMLTDVRNNLDRP